MDTMNRIDYDLGSCHTSDTHDSIQTEICTFNTNALCQELYSPPSFTLGVKDDLISCIR